MKRRLQSVIKILNDSNLKWWLDYGQLLSLHRSGEPLKWKDDWDFCIVKQDERSYDTILKKVKEITNVIFERKGKYIRFDILDLSFDFYFCKENFESKRMEELNFPKKLLDMKLFYFDRLEYINWNGIKFKVPRHLDEYLLIRYGVNWKTPIQMRNSLNIKNHGKEFEKQVTCLVAGIFDGLHQGHQNLIEHAIKYFDKVKVGVHSNKVVDYKETPKHTMSERIGMIVSKYPNVEIIEDCPLVTDKTYLELNRCDYVVFGDENSENINKFYPSEKVNHPIDRYPVLSSRLVNKQSVKSFCINMKDKEERYIDVLKEMSKIGVYPERFTVDKHNVEKRIKREGVNEKSNQILESHLRLYKKLSQTDGDMFLILEDDVMVIDNINLEEVISKAPKDWDVIYLGGVNHHEGHPPVIIDDMFYRAKFTFNTHALLVKKSFIPNIIDELEKREFETDVIFAYMQSKGIGNCYGLIEDSIIQHGKFNTSFITTLSESCFDRVNKLNGDFNIKLQTDVKYDKFLEFMDICKGLTKYLPNEFPIIDKRSNKKSLIVECRELKHNEFVIKNTIQKLGDGWGHIIYCHKNNYDQIKSICDSISDQIEIRLVEKELDRNDYNNLLLDINFWNEIDCEKVLIYQTDTFILNKFDDKFLEFDYLGANWGPGSHMDLLKTTFDLKYDITNGNGGLSLRTMSMIKKSLVNSDFKEKYFSNNHLDKTLDKIPEDVYFSIWNHEYGKIIEDCSDFSIEPLISYKNKLNFDEFPFGFHKLYGFNGWQFFIEKFK